MKTRNRTVPNCLRRSSNGKGLVIIGAPGGRKPTRDARGSNAQLNEETLTQLDKQNNELMHKSLDVKACKDVNAVRSMSQTMQYFNKGDADPTDGDYTENTNERGNPKMEKKRFSSTFSQYYLNNKKAKDLLSVASIESKLGVQKDNLRTT